MQTRLFVLLLLLGANLHATAQSLEAFASGSAGANFVIFSATDTVINGKYIPAAASKLYRIDKATGKATAIVPNGGANYRHLDALGYNPIDNFLYALHDSTTANITPTGLVLHPNTQLVRVDKNGREGILYAIAPPSAGVKPTLIIPTAADIDASGNYYFPAIVIKGITQTEPFVVDFDLYIGRIADTTLRGVSRSTAVTPIYTLVTLGAAKNILLHFVQGYVAALVERKMRPRGGLQDWAIHPRTGQLTAYFAEAQTFLHIDLPELYNPTPAAVVATTAAVVLTTAAATATNAAAAFYDTDGKLYTYDLQKGRFLTTTDTLGTLRAQITAGTNALFTKGVGDGASATTINTGCSEDAYMLLTETQFATATTAAYTKSELLTVHDDANGLKATVKASIRAGVKPIQLDGLVLDKLSGFLYGMSDPTFTGRPALYRVDGNGNATRATTNTATIAPPPTPSSYQRTVQLFATTAFQPTTTRNVVLGFVGESDSKGRMYFPAVATRFRNSGGYYVMDYTLYVGTLDLSSTVEPPTYTPVFVEPGSFTQETINSAIASQSSFIAGGSAPQGGIQDWAINPLDNGGLWTYITGKNIVVRFETAPRPLSDPNPALRGKIVAEAFPNPAAVNTEAVAGDFSGIWFGKDGAMLAVDNKNSTVYSVDISGCLGSNGNCGTLENLGVATAFLANIRGKLSLSDAAACRSAQPTPVQLVHFTGQQSGCTVDLSFTTASETDNASITIEKSTDGNTFTPIATLNGRGTTHYAFTYTYTDTKPQRENYYRLKETDVSGAMYYSTKTVKVVSTCYEEYAGNYFAEIFPNPTTDNVSLKLFSTTPDPATNIVVYNVQGSIVLNKNWSITQGPNLIEIEASTLPIGVYFVQVSGTDWYSETRRFVKVKD